MSRVLDLTRRAVTFEDKLRESGAIAFHCGRKRSDCALHRDSRARLFWQRGYDAARRAAIAELIKQRKEK